jgi:hypothetical protein
MKVTANIIPKILETSFILNFKPRKIGDASKER